MGMRWLDEHHPNWIPKIDLATLNMRKSCYCILGQVYGNYWGVISNDPIALGFVVEHCHSSRGQTGVPAYDELEQEWKLQIKERLEKQS